MGNEFLEMEVQMEQTETENLDAIEQRAELNWENYRNAVEQGDIATARYYLGKYSEMYQSGAEEREADTAGDAELYFGSRETEEVKEAREKADAERSRLERKLRDAEGNLKNSQEALDTLLRNQADGMKGVNPGISNREYQIKVYTKEIANLKHEISNL